MSPHQPEEYLTVRGSAKAEVVIKKSRFLATVEPVSSEDEALEFIEVTRRDHRNATHNVFAYSVGFGEEILRQSDDGEPSGTAGRPVLEVIRREGLRNVAVVVTRYFGGILLGASGLVRAYGEAAKAGFDSAGIVRKILVHELSLTFDYGWLGKIQHLVGNRGAVFAGTAYEDRVLMKLFLRPLQAAAFINEVREFTAARVKPELSGTRYLNENEAPTPKI
jgi:uncharacterized YigZ family protein